uniref:NADH-ubiquinone oxidoreductase chain 6 n=1 Tax=Melophagus ovinus TaxID=452749 RepID=A0A343DCE1_9MUSC|nr:NADH dehydrogenase subunit 6 [Melophagus ovinus]ART65752.1 NADH dehydrogenase subunit 6 [Melophagus ovinus]
MIQWILLMFKLTLNLIFMFMNHPLAMGFVLLIQTTLISMITGLMTYSFWFSYILFIVFLGGMLVLFIYISSLASNEMFSLSMKLFMTSIIFMIMMTIIILFIDKNMNMMSMNFETKNFNNKIYIQENSLLIKMYNYPYNIIIIILMNYLLITLIAIVKITKLSKGPLRPMFN